MYVIMSDELTEDEIKERLEELNIWGIEDGKLATRIEFEDYKETVFFANNVFSLAERYFHHPSVRVEYNSIDIDIWSHDIEGLSERDFELAEEIEESLSDIN